MQSESWKATLDLRRGPNGQEKGTIGEKRDASPNGMLIRSGI